MAKKEQVPAIRFQGFADPWEQRKLSEVFSSYTDPVDIPHDGYERLGIRSHAKGTFHNYVPAGHELQTAQMHRVAANKFIVNITFGWEHAVAVTDENDAGKLVSHRFPQFSLSDELDPQFLKFIILDERFRHHLWLASPGGAGRNRVLNLNQMLQYEIQIPCVAEQRKIAGALINIDTLITLHQRKYDKLVAIKRSMLEKMFPREGSRFPEIRFAGFTDPWEQRKLSDLAEIVGGGTPDTNNSAYWDGDIDWYAPAEMEGQRYAKGSVRKITELGLQKSSAKILPAHRTVLFTSRAGIGKMAILQRPAATNQGFQSLVLKDGTDPYFIYSMGERIKGMAEGVASGSTFLEISGKMLGNLEVMVPNLKEQESIATFFRGIDDLITLHQREHATGDNVRSAQRRQGPHNQINILIFQFMNNVKIRFLCGRHTGMAKSPGYTSN